MYVYKIDGIEGWAKATLNREKRMERGTGVEKWKSLNTVVIWFHQEGAEAAWGPLTTPSTLFFLLSLSLSSLSKHEHPTSGMVC